ncbi:MAG: hypothetical protein HPY89_02120 [Pelotomaculum sp.]|uniref:Uncharacterized protein n=1 Tax=Pelotomaculum thermopropionicum (strain DSM 13744 / JCM 10971 / SI) TaxID=370438 RepID=A5D048_PELTS|nr:hypothetical protein [Pelotomaculum sp.]BAF60392.1 hypothetical protein PTH_2211 [Pelotomaculum thermopropionicum SI]
MQKEIALPEFIGETEQAVILVVPALDRCLSVLFKRFHEGEEIEYWFSWELIPAENGGYMVTLDIGWDGENAVSVGFNLDMWEYLPLITKRGHLVLMTDWSLIEEGISAGVDKMGRFRPRALLVRDVGRGMEDLSSKVAEEAMSNRGSTELIQLLEILQSSQKSGLLLH